MAIRINVEIDSTELINNLKKLAQNSSESLDPIVQTIAESTQRSAKNILGVNRNSGELENSIIITNVHSDEEVGKIIYPTAPYAKYVHDGTSGMWTTPVTASTLNLSKMNKYNMSTRMLYVNGGVESRYQFYGQKPKPFMREAFNATKDSNISFVKSKYIEYLLKGIR